MPRYGTLSNPTKIVRSSHVATKISRATMTPAVCRFASATTAKSKQQQQQQQQQQPPTPSSGRHSDLESFLQDARRRGLDDKSPVFTGTRYEYLVAERLARYGFELRRVGGSSDFGVDLVGEWTVPSSSSSSSSWTLASASARTMRVLVQCKGGIQRVGPHMIRELEGSFAGAPAGWRGEGVLGLLVAERTATKGMRDALGRADAAMGYFCCSGDGVVRQMLWNQRAQDQGLQGIGVALKRGERREDDEVVLVRNGEPLSFV